MFWNKKQSKKQQLLFAVFYLFKIIFFGFILCSFINGIKQDNVVIETITKMLITIVKVFGWITKIVCKLVFPTYSKSWFDSCRLIGDDSVNSITVETIQIISPAITVWKLNINPTLFVFTPRAFKTPIS